MKTALYCRELVGPNGMTKSTVLAAAALRREGHDVEILCRKAASRSRLEGLFGASVEGLAVVEVPDRALPARAASYDLFINQYPGAVFPSFSRRSWLWVCALSGRKPRHLGFYRLLGNSRFTVGKIRRLWGARAEALFPPIGVEDFSPGRKEKVLLSVGALGGKAHPKRELEMIRLFASLHRSGGLRGWTYHLAGELEGGPRWLEKLEAAAGGAPVRFHIDAPLRRMQDLYAKASLLWHACPEEHFGGALVEAMAAGCFVLAPDKAGPREIRPRGREGRLYRSFAELARWTLEEAARPRRPAASRRPFGAQDFLTKARALIRKPSP